ncbi:hypothetical protein BCR32DRAFT_329960 [Anaeromyces robustus]|uniref:Nucleotide-diphospho-sugar transferase n=1 Tax=Anaeromyces robustus TaxID=1754192 RepID=A0A1Y1WNK0_9FUNG|nr:hypothetical protein BCR32DRAFT_329960 [Anaeromyces robustus]|eukprot:ORX75093.1 hypothetical protein BCR32DRAFT_329960 [Anaeromyces robustus]
MSFLLNRRFKRLLVISLIFVLIILFTTGFVYQDNYKEFYKSISNKKTNIEKYIQNNDYTDDGWEIGKENLNSKNNNGNIEIENVNNELIDSLEKIVLEYIKKPIPTKNFKKLSAVEELHTRYWNSIFGKYNTLNETDITNYKNLLVHHSAFITVKHLNVLDGKKKVLASLHQSLYPWLYGFRFKSLGGMIKTFKGKGIVMSAGKQNFQFTKNTIDALRNIHNCTLPIEVFYNGKKDLPKKYKNVLKSYKNVYVTDISLFFNNDIVDMKGWAIKPFSILASRFEEVIFMDAGVVYLKDPKILFENKIYQKTGTLFFRDRTIYPGSNKSSKWIKSWLENPLSETKELRFMKEESRQEMESSTIVIHKLKTLLGVLAVCKLNEKKIHEKVINKKIYEDKETFWIGYDLARQHYSMNPHSSTIIGKVNVVKREICGHLGQMMDNELLYWKDYLFEKEKEKILKFEVYSYDYNGQWNKNLNCLKLNNTIEPTYLNEKELGIVEKYIENLKKSF